MFRESLDEAREAFGRRAWAAALSAYAAAGQQAPLTPDDVERHAIAAHLAGDETGSREQLARGHRAALERGDVARAARFAFWLGHSLIFTGELVQARGWWARARGLLAERGVNCAEWGYVLFTDALEQLLAGDATSACRTLSEVHAIGRRFADPSVVAMALFLRGRALISLGLHGEGMAALDELMVAATTGELHLLVLGHTYCGVIEACWEVFDLRRAREWTAALTRWCEGQPELVPHRGPCLVHRVELMRLHGDWEDALGEARRACDWLSLPTTPEGPADAFYQLGELHRLRGDFSAADAAYRQASRLGRSPEPGVALLWLARGQTDAAEGAARRALAETGEGPGRRSDLLAAYVEVLLALGDKRAARAAANELRELAARLDALPLHAMAERADGSVLIAEGEPRAALAPLRRAWTAWQRLEAPYEAARVRVLLGAACRALGDAESAAMEVDAARWVFERLGAAPDLARLDDAASPAPAVRGLSPRELEVLTLIAAGETNKAIAVALVISQHTVARHVQNMLQKLGFSSRASLAAFAVQEGLAGRPTGQK
jgi:DNA-binding CsgD family transcriptional regulator/tetratricopeptide (TPR) repeat protein